MRTLLLSLLLALPAAAQPPDTVFLEELTWTEVRDLLKVGRTTVIIPTGGTEQNGPHMVLGKHNFRIRHTANRIARALGNALVAPVMAYVPEGDINPPTGHMKFPGTITVPDEYFRKVLEYAARSLQSHGFRDIVFIGDSGPNQPGMKAVAEALSKEWTGRGARVHFIPEYYNGTGFPAWLARQGVTPAEDGTHAGVSDTAMLLAVDPALVRRDKIAPGGGFPQSGVTGDPTKATIALGRQGLDLTVKVTVDRIRAAVAAPQP